MPIGSFFYQLLVQKHWALELLPLSGMWIANEILDQIDLEDIRQGTLLREWNEEYDLNLEKEKLEKECELLTSTGEIVDALFLEGLSDNRNL